MSHDQHEPPEEREAVDDPDQVRRRWRRRRDGSRIWVAGRTGRTRNHQAHGEQHVDVVLDARHDEQGGHASCDRKRHRDAEYGGFECGLQRGVEHGLGCDIERIGFLDVLDERFIQLAGHVRQQQPAEQRREQRLMSTIDYRAGRAGGASAAGRPSRTHRVGRAGGTHQLNGRDAAAELPGSARLSGDTAVWSDWSCVVRVVVEDPSALPHAVADVAAMMRRVERSASRFVVDSDLNWANANAGRPVAVSRTLANLVEAALAEAARSGGLVDPTIGADLVRIGYDRDISLVNDSDEPVPDAPTGTPRRSWRDVRLDRYAGLLTVPRGSALDLGASAKALTADWAAADLYERYGCAALVEIGGDLAVAGRKRDWQILVAERAGQPGQQVTLGGGGLATSSTTIRRWRRADREVSHIVDPATGRPAVPHWRTVSVAADSALRANTCSTAAIVLGEGALTWLDAQRVAARLVGIDGKVVTIGGWPC